VRFVCVCELWIKKCCCCCCCCCDLRGRYCGIILVVCNEMLLLLWFKRTILRYNPCCVQWQALCIESLTPLCLNSWTLLCSTLITRLADYLAVISRKTLSSPNDVGQLVSNPSFRASPRTLNVEFFSPTFNFFLVSAPKHLKHHLYVRSTKTPKAKDHILSP